MVTVFKEFSNQFASMVVDKEGTIFHTDGAAGLWTLGPKGDYSINKLIVQRNHNRFLKGIVWNGEGTFYICDTKTNSILQYHTKTKQFISLHLTVKKRNNVGEQKQATFVRPWSICKDSNGDLYVLDKCSLSKINVQDWTVDTLTTFKAGEEGVAFYDQEIYVTSQNTHCISKFKDQFGWNGVSGGRLEPGFVDGSFLTAMFHSPKELAFTKSGNLLVVDKNGLRMLNFAKQHVSTIYKGKIETCTVSQEGWIFFVTSSEQLIRLIPSWDIQRCLLIARLKEEPSECCVACLPLEILREICDFVFATAQGDVVTDKTFGYRK